MNGRQKGFTLIELLVVIAIIAILASIMGPVFVAAKEATKKTVATQAGRQLWLATSLYLGDHDDRFPPAISVVSPTKWQTWFGLSNDGFDFTIKYEGDGWDVKRGYLSPYRGNRILKDPSHRAVPYIGDMSGFGYNYTYIGSDLQHRMTWNSFPDCRNPASDTELANPSGTIVFATSSFFFPSWMKDGDGQVHDFAFFDPPMYWKGNPNVDFRHHGGRKIDSVKQEIVNDGRAVFVFSGGNVKSLEIGQVEPSMFTRDGKDPT